MATTDIDSSTSGTARTVARVIRRLRRGGRDVDATGQAPRWGSHRTTRLVAVAAVMVLAVFVVAENFVVVEVRLVSWAFQIRLAWAMLICVAVGAVGGWLLGRRG